MPTALHFMFSMSVKKQYGLVDLWSRWKWGYVNVPLKSDPQWASFFETEKFLKKVLAVLVNALLEKRRVAI